MSDKTTKRRRKRAIDTRARTEYSAAWREAHPHYAAEWAAKNREKIAEYQRTCRAKKAGRG